jgi:hypothetical protein
MKSVGSHIHSKGEKMETILIIILVIFLLGGGGWYWTGRGGRGL